MILEMKSDRFLQKMYGRSTGETYCTICSFFFQEKLKHVPLTVCYPDYPEANRNPEDALQHIENQIRSQDMSANSSSTDDLEPKRNLVFYRTHATDPQAFQVRSGHVKSGQVRSGQVRSGQVRSGQVRSGQVRSC